MQMHVQMTLQTPVEAGTIACGERTGVRSGPERTGRGKWVEQDDGRVATLPTARRPAR